VANDVYNSRLEVIVADSLVSLIALRISEGLATLVRYILKELVGSILTC
jgi:fatty acid/phospholipid biosynthesis enzyme